FTPHYLTDRADFLARRLWFSAEDIEPVNPTYGYDGADHPYLRDAVFFEDAAAGDKIAQGFAPESPFPNVQRYFFGDGCADHLCRVGRRLSERSLRQHCGERSYPLIGKRL
ncbi:MAG: hypothetical protein AB1830_17660, partial [Pseudomonadota bacterium]